MDLSRFDVVDAVLTDFDRTLVWLFEDRTREQQARDDLWAVCATRGAPLAVRAAAGRDPYDLWSEAHHWAWARLRPADAETLDHTIASRLAAHEVSAAGRVRLLDGVQATLERLQDLGIPVAVVSNNAPDAVWQVLKTNKIEANVDLVLGRDPGRRLDDLKPNPILIREALAMLKCCAERTLFVGDSVTDMLAGRAAGVATIAVLRNSGASEADLISAGADQVLDRFADLGSLFPGPMESSPHPPDPTQS